MSNQDQLFSLPSPLVSVDSKKNAIDGMVMRLKTPNGQSRTFNTLEELNAIKDKLKTTFTLEIEQEENGLLDINAIDAQWWQELLNFLTNSYCVSVAMKINLEQYIRQLSALRPAGYGYDSYERIEEIRKIEEDQKKQKILQNIRDVCETNLILLDKAKQTNQQIIKKAMDDAKKENEASKFKCGIQTGVSSLLSVGSLVTILMTFTSFFWPIDLAIAILGGLVFAPIYYWLERRPYYMAEIQVAECAKKLGAYTAVKEEDVKEWIRLKLLSDAFVDFMPSIAVAIGCIGLSANPLPIAAWFMAIGVGASAALALSVIVPVSISIALAFYCSLNQGSLDDGVDRQQRCLDTLYGLSQMNGYDLTLSSIDWQKNAEVKKFKEEETALSIIKREKVAIGIAAAVTGLLCGAGVFALIIPSIIVGVFGISLASTAGILWCIGAGIAAIATAVGLGKQSYMGNLEIVTANRNKMNEIIASISVDNSQINLKANVPTPLLVPSPSLSFFGKIKKYLGNVKKVLTNPTAVSIEIGLLSLISSPLSHVLLLMSLVGFVGALMVGGCAKYVRNRVNKRNDLSENITKFTQKTLADEPSQHATVKQQSRNNFQVADEGNKAFWEAGHSVNEQEVVDDAPSLPVATPHGG